MITYYIKLIIVPALCIVICCSCADHNAKALYRLKNGLGEIFKIGLNTKSLAEARKFYVHETNRIKPEDTLTLKPKFSDIVDSIFRHIKYEKPLSSFRNTDEIEGTAKSFYDLFPHQYKISLNGNGDGVFLLRLGINAIRKIDPNLKFELSGKLELLDKENKEIGSYRIYPTPDLTKIIRNGMGQTYLDIYLDRTRNELNETVFDQMETALNKMERSVYFRLVLNIAQNRTFSENTTLEPANIKFKNGKNTGKEMEFEDLLNDLDKKK